MTPNFDTRTELLMAVANYCTVHHTDLSISCASIDRAMEQVRLMNSPLPVALRCHFTGELQRVLIQKTRGR